MTDPTPTTVPAIPRERAPSVAWLRDHSVDPPARWQDYAGGAFLAGWLFVAYLAACAVGAL